MWSKNKKGAVNRTITRRILQTNAARVTTLMDQKTLVGLTDLSGFFV
jgi:hypothetical protein